MTRTDRAPRRRLDPEERRQAIVAAAVDVFQAAPYAEASVAEVAAAAGGSQALVYKYFPRKADLYAAVLLDGVATFAARCDAALAALPDGVPVRDKVSAITVVRLDEVGAHPSGWASVVRVPAGEPETAEVVRGEARAAEVRSLRAVLRPSVTVRHDYALTAWFGFLDAACRTWADRGCPPDERWPLVDAALGALEGALGDWAA